MITKTNIQVKKLYSVLILMIITSFVMAQGVIIMEETKDDSVPHESSILELQSKDKGILIPRMTVAERDGIESPAHGLMVFVDDEVEGVHGFFFYDLTANAGLGQWKQAATGDVAIMPGESGRVAYWEDGTTISPYGYIEVAGTEAQTDDDPIFVVRNDDGDVVFAVYQKGVRIYVDDNPEGDKTARGGFAVGGFTSQKDGAGIEYLRVSPDSTRIYIDDRPGKTARGGFAVGGFTSNKTFPKDYFSITPDSARIFLRDSPGKTARGGFAVGGFTSGKGKTESAVNFMFLTPENYFIGHEAGDLNVEGLYNSFIGYEAGKNNHSGDENIFIGYRSGYSNINGSLNTFLGFESGLSNTGSDNTFVGYRAGSAHLSRGGNVYLGSKAGENATHGEQNVYIGESTGQATTYGKRNVFIGHQSGFNNTGHVSADEQGSYNVYMGYRAGYQGTTLQKNVFIGYEAGRNSHPGSVWWHGSLNVFVGNEAGLENTSGGQNVAVGDEALKNNTTGHWNVAIGKQALIGPNTGNDNISLGKLSLENNTSGDRNIAIGSNTLNKNTTGSQNISIGGGLIFNTEGDHNIGIGSAAGRFITTNSNNIAIGRMSLARLDSGNNTVVGSFAGEDIENGEQNTLIGANVFQDQKAGSYLTAIGSDISGVNFNLHYMNSTAIGYQTTINANNVVHIGNTSITSIKGQVSFTTYSDKRIKENINDDIPGLEFITLLRPVSYNYDIDKQNKMLGISDDTKWDGKNDIAGIRFSGFVAQEVEEAAASIGYSFSGVDKTGVKNDGLYGLRYSEFVVPLVKAVQEQQQIIQTQSELIEKQEYELNKLRNEVELIKKIISAD